MQQLNSSQMIQLAFSMTDAVERFRDRAKQFFYQVMLSGHECPHCLGSLEMEQDSQCRCVRCGQRLDPTVAFQRCPECDGSLRLAIRRYRCRTCGTDVPSRFLFDGLVFDAEYFRQNMAESRERKREQHERVRRMLAESRSLHLQPDPIDLNGAPGLMDALNALTLGSEPCMTLPPSDGFNLKRYQSHILAYLRRFPISLTEVPPSSENTRKDKIWRFIAIIFLAHAGVVDIWQDGQDIMVRKNETDTEGQGVPGDVAAVDAFEGAIC